MLQLFGFVNIAVNSSNWLLSMDCCSWNVDYELRSGIRLFNTTLSRNFRIRSSSDAVSNAKTTESPAKTLPKSQNSHY